MRRKEDGGEPNKKIVELTENRLEQVTGGIVHNPGSLRDNVNHKQSSETESVIHFKDNLKLAKEAESLRQMLSKQGMMPQLREQKLQQLEEYRKEVIDEN